MALVLDRLNIKDRNIELSRLSAILTDVVNDNGGTMNRRDSLIQLARRAAISRSEVTLVLAYAKARGALSTGADSSDITTN